MSCPLHALLNFEGQFLLSLEGAVGDQSHNIMKLGYHPLSMPSVVFSEKWLRAA